MIVLVHAIERWPREKRKEKEKKGKGRRCMDNTGDLLAKVEKYYNNTR